jgi:molecular chaperone GrpE
METETHQHDEAEEQGPVVRDKRRIDPRTGALREPAEPAPAAPPGADGGEQRTVDPAQVLEERTADLQRLQAEYSNYRRRVERDRSVARDAAVADVLGNLLPVLDDIGRARDHGELEGGFKSVGEALEQTVERLGLVGFGAVGDPFDPTVHEALTHTHSDEVTVPTCVEVFAPGYRIGDRVLRPARVAVADPQQ